MHTLTVKERALYHQIHPAKLLTDIASTPLSLYLLWRHRFPAGMVATVVPAIVASWLVMRYADLQPYKASLLGAYLREYMTPAMQGVRLGGFVVMMVGAWSRQAWPVALGLGIVAFGWARGLILPRK